MHTDLLNMWNISMVVFASCVAAVNAWGRMDCTSAHFDVFTKRPSEVDQLRTIMVAFLMMQIDHIIHIQLR